MPISFGNSYSRSIGDICSRIQEQPPTPNKAVKMEERKNDQDKEVLGGQIAEISPQQQ